MIGKTSSRTRRIDPKIETAARSGVEKAMCGLFELATAIGAERLNDALRMIGKSKRLQDRLLEVSGYRWGLISSLFECGALKIDFAEDMYELEKWGSKNNKTFGMARKATRSRKRLKSAM